MNKIIFNNVELESFSDHLLDEFANSVEEDNGVEKFGIVISQLVWLRDNYCR